MGRVAFNDARFDGVSKNAAEKTNGAYGRSRAASTMAFPRSVLVLTETRVFPAIMSLRTLLMSVLVRSLTRRVPMSGMMRGKGSNACRALQRRSRTHVVAIQRDSHARGRKKPAETSSVRYR
jgi:hypothetical protein